MIGKHFVSLVLWKASKAYSITPLGKWLIIPRSSTFFLPASAVKTIFLVTQNHLKKKKKIQWNTVVGCCDRMLMSESPSLNRISPGIFAPQIVPGEHLYAYLYSPAREYTATSLEVKRWFWKRKCVCLADVPHSGKHDCAD